MTETLRCDNCDEKIKLIDDNGAEFPETRKEYYECTHCGHTQTVIFIVSTPEQ